MIVLLTHSQDYYTIDGVELNLAAMGADYRRLNTDDFPETYGMSVDVEDKVWLQAGDHLLDLSQATAVWARRVWPGRLPADFPEVAQGSSQAQCRNFFHEVLGLLDQAYWVNDWKAGQAAESKLLQLRVAREVGLRVPPTLVTTVPERVLEFAAAHPQGLITKLLVPNVQSMEGHPDFAYTTKIPVDRLPEGLEVIRWMPQIFQPCLKRVREYRAIVVAGEFFVGAVEVANPERVDWRAATPEDGIRWQVAQLETALQDKIRQLLQALGLVYGAVDLLLDESGGEPYFLEVNQAGEWGWLERDLGLPIAERIARTLVERR